MTIASISQERLARFLDPNVHLISGSGTGINGNVEGCVVNFTNWLVGGDGADDDHPCIDPTIRRFAIGINDAEAFAEWRDELKPFAARLANTRNDVLLQKRGFMSVDWATRTIAPLAFEYWAESVPKRRDEALSWANKLRDVPPIVDAASARAGREVARSAAADAYAASAYAYAAYAAASASAASAAAYAASAAASASAASAATFRRRMFEESLAFLGRLIDVGASE